MALKYQIFISSTFEDLEIERAQVIRAVLEMGHIPVGMEMFSAADDEQWTIIARTIDEVDYYVVILAHRYGSVTSTGVSYTEKEYDYAVSKGIPVLGFVLDEKATWVATKFEKDETKRQKMSQFRSKVCGRMVNFWQNKDDLHGKFSVAMMKTFSTNPRVGWTRANEVAGPEVVKELTRLSAENAGLRRQLNEMSNKEHEHDKDQIREVYGILGRTKKTAFVRFSAADWGEPIETTLLRIFSILSSKLLIENHTEAMAGDLAVEFSGKTNYHLNWPVPENYIGEWLGDLHALNLVEASKRKHSVNDKAEYWCLSELGRQLHKLLRRFALEKGDKLKQELAPEGEVGHEQKASAESEVTRREG